MIVGTCIGSSAESVASPLDQLADLTGKANVIVTLTGRDNFNSEYRTMSVCATKPRTL